MRLRDHRRHGVTAVVAQLEGPPTSQGACARSPGAPPPSRRRGGTARQLPLPSWACEVEAASVTDRRDFSVGACGGPAHGGECRPGAASWLSEHVFVFPRDVG